MILKINASKMAITSEDPMDAEYLNSLFADSVRIEKKSDLVRCGFHVTEEKSVCVEFIKVSIGGEK